MKKYLSVAGNYKSAIGQFQNNSVNVAMLITMSRVIIVLYMYNYKRSFFNVSLFCYIKHSSVPYCRGQTKCIFSKFQPSVSFNNNNGLLICESLGNFYTSHFSSPNSSPNLEGAFYCFTGEAMFPTICKSRYWFCVN